MIGPGMTGIMWLQSVTGCPPHEHCGGSNVDDTQMGQKKFALIKLHGGSSLSCKHTGSDDRGMTTTLLNGSG